MRFSAAFFRATAVASALAAVLVLVAQLGLDGYPRPATAEAFILLHTHPLFRAQAWVILAQVFLMFLALWGAAVAASRRSPGLLWTGLLVFALWQVFELLPRAITGWTLMGDWAPAWAASTDPAVRAGLEARFLTILGMIEASAGIRRQLWGLGHLLFGLAFVRWAGQGRILGVLFLFNAARLILRGVGEAAGVEILPGLVGGRVPFMVGMVPLFGLLAVWLWRWEEEEEPC